MRSSPNFLVVSRSEEAGGGNVGQVGADSARSPAPLDHTTHQWPRRDDLEFNELNVSLKISYKTLVLAFVLFDVFHKVVNVVFDLDFL
uniref:Uncharacterized protein n=1 Tax=Leviviridae sp. TaxID=2027243 RepID=A0A514D505_9VIRU|nr:MAG: hypothetical protein H1Rhizo271023_000003 [Leviviridae sp.]